MRYVIIGILLVAYIIFEPTAVMNLDKWVQMFVYHFVHGSIFHLVANIFVVYMMFARWKKWQIVLSFVIACIAFWTASTPIVGFSNVIYAMIGLKTPSFDSSWWKLPSTRVFLIVTLAMLFFPNVSALTHIVSFVLGCSVSLLVRWCKIIKNDSARYI